MVAVSHHSLINIHDVSTFHVTPPPLYGVPRKCVPAVAPLSTADGASAVIVNMFSRAPKVSKKCIVRANESEQECDSCKHSQRSGYAPRYLRLPRLKPKESSDPDIFVKCIDCHRSICTFSAFSFLISYT